MPPREPRPAGGDPALAGSPAARLARLVARYDPAVARVARGALTRLRALVPGAVELVYDNYNALAIGLSPTERASDVVVSIALYPRWVTLFFLQNGPTLPDPTRILRGSGVRVRHVVLESAATLDAPAVRALVKAALRTARVPIDPAARRRTVIKSISKKQRPRRSTARAGEGARRPEPGGRRQRPDSPSPSLVALASA